MQTANPQHKEETGANAPPLDKKSVKGKKINEAAFMEQMRERLNQGTTPEHQSYQIEKMHLNTPKSAPGKSVEEMLADEMVSSGKHAEEAPPTATNNEISASVQIPTDMIDPSPFQPRMVFDDERIMSLAESMQANGQQTAIIVRRKENGRYELIAGERRWRASKIIKWLLIRAEIKVCTDPEAEISALVDNDAREDLSDYERAKKYKSLLDREIVANQADLGRHVGREKTFISRCMAFFDLPLDVLNVLDRRPDAIGAAMAGMLTALLKSHPEDEDVILKAVTHIVVDGWTQNNAINWAKGQIKARHSSTPAPTIRTLQIGNRRLGEMRTVDARKIVISCAPGVDREEVLKILSGIAVSD